MRGIYGLAVARPDGSVSSYIGQAEDIEKRQIEHLTALRRGDHYNRHLQRAYDKYGEVSLSFAVLEETDGDLLLREQFWYDARVEYRGRGALLNAVRPETSPSKDRMGRFTVDGVPWYCVLTSPDGREHFVEHLAAFCKAWGLTNATMRRVVNGELGQHRGWTGRLATPEDVEFWLDATLP